MYLQHFFQSLWGIINEMSPYILLGFIIAGFLHVFVKPSAMTRHLAGGGLKPVVKAALFGIPLPLCSCGVLPTAVALRRQGASKGATTSFLIATPQTGVDSIAATYSLLGLPFAILRPVAALAGAVLGGFSVDRFNRNGDGVQPVDDNRSCNASAAADDDEYRGMSIGRKIIEAVRYGLVDMVGSVGKWLVIGLIVAALITVLVPDQLFVNLSRYPLLAMGVMILVAVPMYICATGSIPIALSLMLKGLSPGVAFVLLMAGPAANFASVMILSRAMGRKATMMYVGAVVVTAVGFGLLIDMLLPASWFVPGAMHGATCHGAHTDVSIFATACSALLAALLIYTSIKFRGHGHAHNHNINEIEMERKYRISGMACPHCQATVTKAISALEGVKSVSVDLASGIATVTGDVNDDAVSKAVYDAGFNVEDSNL
ncbi:MAG: SO_0444 family Cu/Zn efflux transporter [Duncaniella sp.]|nr:SO_0444 family Cu/Zn efflux transporter [Duncaniella sp.]